MKVKASRYDFKESNLPSNRKELFFDILKNNFRVLLKIGLILVIFAIPFFVASIWKDFMKYSFYSQYASNATTDEELKGLLLVNNLIFDAINCLTLGILGIGIAGVIKIVKRLCFLDPVFFMDDIKAGIKDNGKYMFFLFFLFGVIILINNYSSIMASTPWIGVIPTCISFAIIMPTFLFMIMVLAIYNVKFFSGLYTSFMLYVKSALTTLLAYFIFISPFAILFIGNILLKYGLLALIMFLIVPLTLIAFFAYSCSIFDKHINAIQYPEIYRKGLVDRNKLNK